jgi:hypothetical protein
VRPVAGRTVNPVEPHHLIQQQQQQVAVGAGIELLPSIQPLSVPGTLSDEEAWRIALTQPWVIQQEAARAQQLLAQVGVAAGSATGSRMNGNAVAAAAAAQNTGKDATAAMQAPASRKAAAAPVGLSAAAATAAAAAAAVAAAAGYNCQGVHRVMPGQQQQVVKVVQQQQQGPSPRTVGVLGGALRSSNIVNTL